MKHAFFLFAILFSSSLYSQYGQEAYFLPHNGNTLKLHQKNDFHIASGYLQTSFFGNSSIVVTKKIQLGYSPFKNVDIAIHHSRMKLLDRNNYSTKRNNNHLTGIDIGGYHSFKFHLRRPKKREILSNIKYKRILFDLYGGYSNGQHTNYFHEVQNDILKVRGISEINVHKLYLQGGIHYLGRITHMSLFLKQGKLFYYDGKIEGKTSSYSYETMQSIFNSTPISFIDVTYKLELNFKDFGFFIEITGDIRHRRIFSQINVIGHIGISANFNKRYQKH